MGRRVRNEARVRAGAALEARRAVELGHDRRAGVDEHDAPLVAADARELAPSEQAREVGELARELGAGVAAARNDEREQPPPLVRVALDLGQLEHLEQVVPQSQAVGEGLQLERVLGEARVDLEVLGRADADHEVVVDELGARAVEVAARDHAPRVEVDRLDLRHVHRSGREDPPRRAEHVPDADASGDHLADEPVEGVEVLAADDGRAELAALDGVAQGRAMVTAT